MLAMMVKEFNTQINHEKIGEAAEKTKMSIHDIVTIASMVELEAVFKEEQPRIAGVFLRRLQIICRYSPTLPFNTFWAENRKKK